MVPRQERALSNALPPTRESANDYFTIFDGRGNLSGMLNTSGQVVAGYQYSAFGERVAAVGSMKDAFRFGWSTKFLDGHTNLLNFGLRWYDAANGRFVNRDPIGEQGGINLYAFLANNPLGGYELLGMGFLSKLFKGIVNFIKKVVIRVVLAAIPVVGVFLSAAYTAYMWGKSVYDGYRSGGVLGAVAGFVAGPGIGGGSSWAEVLKNAFSETLRKELIASAVRKVDRRVRGFAKWFGVASSIYSVYNGRSPVKESFAELSGALEGSISGSPQLGGKLRKGAETKYGEWGELEVVGPVSDEELRGDYGKTLRDIMSPLKAAISPERAALEASFLAMKAARDAQIAAARNTIAGVANASQRQSYSKEDSARASMVGMMNSDLHKRNTTIVVVASTAPAVIYYGGGAVASWVAAHPNEAKFIVRAIAEGINIWTGGRPRGPREPYPPKNPYDFADDPPPIHAPPHPPEPGQAE